MALGPGSVIPVGGDTLCSATYTLTQADIDAGVVRAGWHADTHSRTGPDPAMRRARSHWRRSAADALALGGLDGISPAGPARRR